MHIPHEAVAVRQAEEHLAEIFGVSKPAEGIYVVEGSGDGRQWEAGAAGSGLAFAVTWKRSGSPGHVATAIRQLEAVKGRFGYGVIPVLAVPYMGEAAQALCAQAELCWLDLSGNARVVAPGVFYQNLGNRNRFRRAGRPESAFGAKGARITRRLLMEPDRPVRQRRLALSTGLNEGHTSRIVGKLVEAGLVERGKEGVRVVDAKAVG